MHSIQKTHTIQYTKDTYNTPAANPNSGLATIAPYRHHYLGAKPRARRVASHRQAP
jgi:hypothetical protein